MIKKRRKVAGQLTKKGEPRKRSVGQGRPIFYKSGDMEQKISMTFSISRRNWLKIEMQMKKYDIKKSEVFEDMAGSYFE